MALNLSKVKGAPVGRKIQFIEPAQQPSDSGKVSAEGEFIFVPVTIEDIVNPIARHHDTVYGVYHEVEEPLKADGQQDREQRAGAIRTLKGRLPEEFIKPEFKAIVAALGGEARKYAQVISKYLMTYF